MFKFKILVWFLILLVIPLTFSGWLVNERQDISKEIHLLNLSLKGAPVLSINENTFKNDMEEAEKFKLIEKVSSYKNNADEVYAELKEKTDGKTNEELTNLKNYYSDYDMFITNIYKQMQVGNFIDIQVLEKVSNIYNLDKYKVDNLVPIDYSTIGWILIIYYVCVLLLVILYYHPAGFIDIFLDIILLGFIFKN